MDDTVLARQLRVARLDVSGASDAQRGPMVRMHPDEARRRLLMPNELAWVHGPRRYELAEVVVDDAVPRGEVILRDVSGAAPSELVRVVKPDFDRRSGRGALV